DGTINGDLIATGSIITINGTVKGSLVAAGQTIILNGTVEGSIYSGSSTFTLGNEASVGRNFFYGGFNLTTEAGSVVDRDLLVGAYQALLAGEIGRDVKAGVGALELNGKIGGDVTADVDAPNGETQIMPFYGGPPGVETIVPAGIRVSEGAEIGGKLTYNSPAEQAIAIQASPGDGVEFTLTEMPDTTVPQKSPAAIVGHWMLKRLQEFITLLVLGALAVWQLPQLFNKVTDTVQAEPLPATGWGLVVIVIGYIGALLVGGLILAAGIFFGIITLGGLAKTVLGVGFSGLALIIAVFGLLVAYVSKLVVAWAGGKLILQKLAPQYEDHKVWPLVVGVLIYVLLRSIPILGRIIGILVTMAGMGAMWLLYRSEQAPTPEVTD
ncbi:MAG: polymer-forming cytoskeletal protein, partial [Chloroflexota bacterium]|nr:polymer-forming cytoskeletal protein [Chloroflexota bacterium]